MGMISKLNWMKNLEYGETRVFDLKGQTLYEVTRHMESTFPEAILRVVGDPALPVQRAAYLAGAPGSRSHIRMMQRGDIDLIVIGEAPEWETIEYVRDASQAGLSRSLIILGHAVSEEAGMEYCAEWLRTFIKDIPVHFIPAGDPFHQ